MSDSDDSDIGDLMAKVKRERQLQTHGTTNDDSDASSADENENPYQPYSKKKRGLNFDEKLTRMEQRMSIQGRKLATRRGDDSSDDSDDEEEDVDSRVKNRRRANDRNAIKVNVEILDEEEESAKPKADDSLYISSDEESIQGVSAKNGRYNLRRGGGSTAIAGMEEFQLATAALQNAQRSHVESSHHSPTKGGGCRRLLKITVEAKLQKYGSLKVTSSSVALEIYENEPVQSILDKFYEASKLNPKTTTMHLTFQGKRLIASRSAASYDIAPGSTIEANIVLTDFSATETKKVDPGKNLGKTVSLVLRRVNGKADERDVIKIRQKQPFKFLVEEYRSLKSLPPSCKVVLRFDGENLSLEKTPESEDMDDEDLVDVTIA